MNVVETESIVDTSFLINDAVDVQPVIMLSQIVSSRERFSAVTRSMHMNGLCPFVLMRSIKCVPFKCLSGRRLLAARVHLL
jgi:hypothetical protein